MRLRRTSAYGLLAAVLMMAACHQPAVLSDADLNAAALAIATPKPHATAKPSGVPATKGVIVQAGDSIGLGNGAEGNWAAIDHLGLPRGIAVHNVSVNGQWMLTGLGRRETDLFPFYDPKRTSVLVIQQGTNDLAGGKSGASLYQDVLKPFVALSQKAGFYVVVDTILPRADPGWVADDAHERERQTYNRMVRENSIGADAINDLAADPVVGDAQNPATSLLYYDTLHLRKEGQERIAKVEAKTLATMLEYPPRQPNAN